MAGSSSSGVVRLVPAGQEPSEEEKDADLAMFLQEVHKLIETAVLDILEHRFAAMGVEVVRQHAHTALRRQHSKRADTGEQVPHEVSRRKGLCDACVLGVEA